MRCLVVVDDKNKNGNGDANQEEDSADVSF